MDYDGGSPLVQQVVTFAHSIEWHRSHVVILTRSMVVSIGISSTELVGMIQIAFWTSFSALVYAYIGYPFLLICLRWLISKRYKRGDESYYPSVSLVISAYNEQTSIADKLANSLSLDYPYDKLEVIVASDGSTDNTNIIVNSFANQGVKLLIVTPRLGKTNVQNQAIKVCTGQIVVFTDANSLLQRDAIRKLVSPFADPRVGCVEGRRLDRNVDDSATAEIELKYRDYETILKSLESKVGLCLGATGPIYSIRRDIYVPLDENLISDLMEPIAIYKRHGLYQVFEPLAISREDVLSDIDREYHRKVRIITRCLNSLFSDRQLLNPLKNPVIFFQVTSHRLIRWFAPVFILIIAVSNLLLIKLTMYQFTAIIGFIFTIFVLIGSRPNFLFNRYSILRAPYYYYKVNMASLMAIINWIRAVNIQTWTPDR